MLNNKMDERMLLVRGKGLLYGFMSLIILIVLKDFVMDMMSITIPSTTRIDIAIIYISIYIVSTYMLIHDAVSEEVVKTTRYVFLILSLVFGILLSFYIVDNHIIIDQQLLEYNTYVTKILK